MGSKSSKVVGMKLLSVTFKRTILILIATLGSYSLKLSIRNGATLSAHHCLVASHHVLQYLKELYAIFSQLDLQKISFCCVQKVSLFTKRAILKCAE